MECRALARSGKPLRTCGSCPSSRCLTTWGSWNCRGIAWVIVGGESGPGARPMRREWVESILLQCRAANVPFFFKQWGGPRKNRTGRLLFGRTYDEMPPRSSVGVPDRDQRRALRDELRVRLGRLDLPPVALA